MKQKRKKIIATFMMILILLNNSLNVFATEEVVAASEEPVASIEATNSETVQEEPAASVEEVQDQEAPAETVTTPEKNDSAAETQNEAPVQDEPVQDEPVQDEPVLEEPKLENKEPAVTVGEEMANSENNSEEDVLVEEKASVEKTTEESDTSDEEELLITDEEEKDVIVEEDEDKEDDKEDLSETMPEHTFEEQIGNVHVKVIAEEGTFYANTRMEAKLIEKETIIDSLENVVEDFVDTVVAVDITFYNEANEIVEPEKAVNVEITSDEINKMDDPVIAHLDNDGNTEVVNQKEKIASNNKVGFEADSFSVYAIFGTIETTYITADGQSYNITVTYNANSGIPKDAKLEVREISLGTEEYNNYNNQALDKIGVNAPLENTEKIGGSEGLYELEIVNPPMEENFARFFDITIISEGKKIEPLIPVDVKITYNEPIDLSNNKELKVVHFADNGIETISPNVNGSEVSFKQSSFSVTGTITTSVNNSRSYAVLVQHEGDFYEIKYDGTLEKVTASGSSYTIAMAEAWTYNNNGIYVTTNNGRTYIRPNDANGLSTTETRITRTSSGTGYTFSNDNQYLGVTTDTVTGQLKISGNNSSSNT